MRTRFVLVVGLLVCYVGIASAQVREAWVARYDRPVNLNDSASDIAVDAQGNTYVTGAICAQVYSGLGCTDYDWATLKYDADGNKLWSVSYDASSFDGASAVAVDGAGSVYVTGAVCAAESWDELGGYCFDSDYTTIKYDTAGNQLWVARYGGPANDSEDRAGAIVLDTAGNVHVTGSSMGVDHSYRLCDDQVRHKRESALARPLQWPGERKQWRYRDYPGCPGQQRVCDRDERGRRSVGLCDDQV